MKTNLQINSGILGVTWGWLEGSAPFNGWTHGLGWEYGCTHRTRAGAKLHAWATKFSLWAKRTVKRRKTRLGILGVTMMLVALIGFALLATKVNGRSREPKCKCVCPVTTEIGAATFPAIPALTAVTSDSMTATPILSSATAPAFYPSRYGYAQGAASAQANTHLGLYIMLDGLAFIVALWITRRMVKVRNVTT